jgi:glycosyltransferase involved in cell wall biosynthesis
MEKIFEAYRDCCFLISTSLFEPFGLVIPEAMSCGLPVVAFDCPYGPADLIADQKDGFLIQDRDLAAFADRVCELIENEELRLKMGQTAKLSSKRYDAEAVMPLWMQLLGQLVAAEKRKSSESDDR